jgi:uncharacterized membrane protein
MLKQRLEALADAMFPIIMTLLVIEIKVPEHLKTFSEGKLWDEIVHTGPLFFAFILSFAILVNLWFGHVFLFSMMIKNVNRTVGYLHMFYLGIICLLPYSTHLLGEYPTSTVAISFYAVHMFVIYSMFLYLRHRIVADDEIENLTITQAGLEPIDWWYGSVRIKTNMLCSIISIILSFVNPYLAVAIIVLTVFIQTIPGLMKFLLQVTGLEYLFNTRKNK